MTHYLVGTHHTGIHDSTIVELYSGEQHSPPTTIVARVEELKRLGYWKNGARWNFAHGERKHAIANGAVPQWRPVVDDAKTEQPQRPHIDDSDPNNPIFRTVVANHEFSFSIQCVPKERQERLASTVASCIREAYIYGQKEARAEMQAAIRKALML